MLSQIANIEIIARDAVPAFVATNSCRAANVPAVIDDKLSNVERGISIRDPPGSDLFDWPIYYSR